jgi:hypothetical protein
MITGFNIATIILIQICPIKISEIKKRRIIDSKKQIKNKTFT